MRTVANHTSSCTRCHKHHGVKVVAAHKLTEVEMREVELGECQLATVVHHVLAEEMGEDGGVNTSKSCKQIDF